MDEFYTHEPNKLLKFIQKYITNNDILIEPSCGDGSFLNILKFTKCYDIIKKVDTDIFQCKDFLQINDIEPDACFIGNPPFGKNSKLAIEFCKHCCELKAKYIMFILPEVFKQDKYKIWHSINVIIYSKNTNTMNSSEMAKKLLLIVFSKYGNEKMKTERIQKLLTPNVNTLSI